MGWRRASVPCKAVYKINASSSYLTLADNLSATKNDVLDTRPAALGLAADERVTKLRFVFGTVKAGFTQAEPRISTERWSRASATVPASPMWLMWAGCIRGSESWECPAG